MNRIPALLFCVLVFFSCKKEKKDADAPPVTAPVKTGSVSINALSYDSLGGMEPDQSGVAVSLYKTPFSAVTNSSGLAVFNNVPYGTVLPVLQKPWYEGLPVGLTLNSGSLSASIPFARYSAYRVNNLSGAIYSRDSIPLTFMLDRAIPAGRICKLAILFSDTIITRGSYKIIDTLHISSQVVQKLNVAKLPNLRAALSEFAKNKFFYICVVPVSYGLCLNTISGKDELIGESLYFPGNVILIKNW